MVKAGFPDLVRWLQFEIMKAKELQRYLNSLSEDELLREVMLNSMDDNIESVDFIRLSKDNYGDDIIILSSEFGYYGEFNE